MGYILPVQARGLIYKGIRRKYQYTIQCMISSMIEVCACVYMFVYARTAKFRKASETKKLCTEEYTGKINQWHTPTYQQQWKY